MNKSVKLLLIFLSLAITGLLMLDFFVVEHHPHFHYEEQGGFYGVFGFVAFMVLVFGAKYLLRPLVFRKEDFYE